ncbi:serine/threonine-protein kinase [Polyangium sorediatum]|uniref:Protein kinase n=1 Tax=Polyangium sorediatum TaxID=889274 RepID=A0ABT6NY07_9BACT|nr:serine/threonine protein kinase [Polyangium sorediatum]MDI1433194.1 protein kinase [Polyangium sorediatum]
MEVAADLAVGTVFASRYRIVRRIAAGGMGAVFEVLHLETERRRALKVMHAHLFQSEELRERFKREAKVAAHVESEFIVDVFDAGVDEATGMPFLVMELLRGEELGERLKRVGKLSEDEALLYLHQTARALDKTHRASIVHRDLKPANVFLTERDEDTPRVKILDFGIAKVVAEGATTGGATQSLGTPFYMAPEQYNPSARLTGAADIYALGMMAYTLLVGAPYWSEEARGGNVYALIAVAIGGPREPASMRAARRGVALPPAFDAWFAKVTALDPAQRYPTATAAVQALAEVLGAAAPARGVALSVSGEFHAPTGMQATIPLRAAASGIPVVGPPMPVASKSDAGPAPMLPDATAPGAAATNPTPTKAPPVWPLVAGGVGLLAVAMVILVSFVVRTTTAEEQAPAAATMPAPAMPPVLDQAPQVLSASAPALAVDAPVAPTSAPTTAPSTTTSAAAPAATDSSAAAKPATSTKPTVRPTAPTTQSTSRKKHAWN